METRIREICRNSKAEPRKPEGDGEAAKDEPESERQTEEVNNSDDQEDEADEHEQGALARRTQRHSRIPSQMDKEQDERDVEDSDWQYGLRGPGCAQYGHREEARCAEPENAEQVGSNESDADLRKITEHMMHGAVH